MRNKILLRLLLLLMAGIGATFLAFFFMPTQPQGPAYWVDQFELTCNIPGDPSYPCYSGTNGTSPGAGYTPPTYVLTLGTSGGTFSCAISGCTLPPPTLSKCVSTSTLYPSGFSLTSANYTASDTGILAAAADIEKYRSCSGPSAPIGFIVLTPPGLYGFPASGSASNGLIVQQSSTAVVQTPIIFRSTMHGNLVGLGSPCRGGIERNLPESTAPGVINSDCSGTNMQFEAGPVNTNLTGPGTITGIDQVSVNTTTYTAITASASAQLVNTRNGYISPVNWTGASYSVTIDPAGNPETVTPVSCLNQSGLCAVFTKNHAAGVCVLYNVTAAEVAATGNTECYGSGNGTGNFTLANGTATNVSQYNYLRYMVQLTMQTASPVIQLCSPVATGNSQCLNASGAASPQSFIGPSFWEFQDFALSFVPNYYSGSGIVSSGGGSVEQAATSTCVTPPFAPSCYTNFAQHIHFSYDWIHGDWTSLQTGGNSTPNAIDFEGCAGCSLSNSQISQVLRPSIEGHIILPGNIQKIDNVVMEGESSGIFCGGETFAYSWANFLACTDLEIHKVDEGIPFSWLGAGNIPASNPNYSSGTWNIYRKNCQEFKEAARVLENGFFCGDVDGTGGQFGVLLQNGIRNSNSASWRLGYNHYTSDLYFENGIFHDSCNGFVDLGGRSSSVSDGMGVSWTMTRLFFTNLLEYAVSELNPGCAQGKSRELLVGGGGQLWNATVYCNGSTCTATAIASVDAGVKLTATSNANTACPAPYATNFCATYTTSGSTAAVNNTLCGNPNGAAIFVYGFSNPLNNSGTGYPHGFFTCAGSTASTLILVNYNGGTNGDTASTLQNNGNPAVQGTAASQTAAQGFQVIDIREGEPVSLFPAVSGQCATFAPGASLFTSGNAPGTPTGIAPLAIVGSAQWQGSYSTWTAAMAQASFASGLPNGTSDQTGLCFLTNVQGGTTYSTVTHVGIVSPNNNPIEVIANPSPGNFILGAQFAQSFTLADSYFLTAPGCTAGGCGWTDTYAPAHIEGVNTEMFAWDATSMSAYGLWFPGRTNTYYAEFPNNPAYPETWGSPCGSPSTVTLLNGTNTTGCQPPTDAHSGGNWGFPATANCTGTTPSYSGPGTGCVGFLGAMSTGTMPTALADYHGYELCGNTVTGFSACGANSPMYHASPDNSGDIGPNIPAIDTALISALDACPTYCGTPGPFPDGAVAPLIPAPTGLTPKVFAALLEKIFINILEAPL
jgi:hypothetical protein